MMILNDNYTTLQLDFIRELTNIGGGNAATSISQLINKPVNMLVPTIELKSYNEIYEETLAEDIMVSAVVIRMLGDAEGIFLFVTTPELSKNLIKMMLPDDTQVNDELRDSAIKELVNILVGSFLNAISQIVKINLLASEPFAAEEMFGAILSSVYMESEQYEDNVMIIKNEFVYQGDKIDSSLYFVPKPGVLGNFFKIIGV